MAEAFQQAYQPQRLIVLPSHQSPLKGFAPQLPAAVRLRLCRESLAHVPTAEVSDWELRRPGISYTMDTVAHFQSLYPDAALYCLIGSDQAVQLSRWHRIGELAARVIFVVAARQTTGALPAIPGLRMEFLPFAKMDISSSRIREALEQGQSVDQLVPAPVREELRKLIRDH